MACEMVIRVAHGDFLFVDIYIYINIDGGRHRTL